LEQSEERALQPHAAQLVARDAEGVWSFRAIGAGEREQLAQSGVETIRAKLQTSNSKLQGSSKLQTSKSPEPSLELEA
jgi:hypothetical protein